MAFLCLNFYDNLHTFKRGTNNDIYKVPLNDQFENIKKKLNMPDYVTLGDFVERIFPSQIKKSYWISMPGFDRSTKNDKYLNNIVIRAKRDEISNDIIPPNYDIIFIGDVYFGTVISVNIKGFDIIDTDIKKFGEKDIECKVLKSFSKKSIMDRNGWERNVYDYNDDNPENLYDPVLTYNFVDSLCNDVSPIKDPKTMINVSNILKKWEEYIDFRKYYLEQQSNKEEPITDITVCDSYMISRNDYEKDKGNLQKYILDDVESFKNNEQIILSKKISGADFPLICIEIDRNRKEILEETAHNRKPKYEEDLRRFTHESMQIVNTNAGRKNNGIMLGERYLFNYIDIEPDCKDIQFRSEDNKKNAVIRVNNKYNRIIDDEVNRFINGEQKRCSETNSIELEKYSEDLSQKLDKDVALNKDEEVIKAYENAIKEEQKPITQRFKVEEDKYKKEIKKIEQDMNLGKDEKASKMQSIKEEFENKKEKHNIELNQVNYRIILKDFYVMRNEKLINRKKEGLEKDTKKRIDELRRNKDNELKTFYEDYVKSEIEEENNRIQQEADKERLDRIDNDTIRKYRIYFRPDDTSAKLSELQKIYSNLQNISLKYDTRAEKAKIDRQERALKSLKEGYVKNPYLASYLFEPKFLSQANLAADEEIEWYLESLNDKQKTAVRKALVSDSIFLLQGPPGTGKTQVIAELTAQFVKRGKKVLISSETHKAIDNVFERLPKTPEIRPLRLIPTQSGKETNYSPEKLVDNFYLNIRENLEKQIDKFDRYSETKEDFWDNMNRLRADYGKLLKLKQNIREKESNKSNLSKKINIHNSEIEKLRSERSEVSEKLDIYEKTIKNIKKYRFDKDGTNENYIIEYSDKCKKILTSFECFRDISNISKVMNADMETIKKEIDILCSHSHENILDLQREKEEIRENLKNMRDQDTDEPPNEGDVNYEDYNKERKRLIEISKELKNLEDNSNKIEDMNIYKIVSPSILTNKQNLKKIPEMFKSIKHDIYIISSEIITNIENEITSETKKLDSIESNINNLQIENNNLKKEYEDILNDYDISNYEELNSKLKRSINKFFKDFTIVKEYDTHDLESAFTIITEEWNALDKDFAKRQAENKIKIPMYSDISNYLSLADILDEDRREYTRELLNNVNVFGITSTSRDSFTGKQLEELQKYGIEKVDVKEQGIDVVIIDEVSKSSFLDLLIPILYGKTIILVGDHRQLPPMYDLRHLRDNDFEDLDSAHITKERNKEFTELYEECFFKTLYENAPEDFKVMLDKQYRCHSQIMDVFNHFYYGKDHQGLEIGKKQQDNEKEHELTVNIKGHTIIEPSKHIYFVDCEEKESRNEGSTSIINEQEAKVVVKLLEELNDSAVKLGKKRNFNINKDRQIDERPSIGVICTYGDQAGNIKRKIRHKAKSFKGFSEKDDEKFIISTVDDFQGDERDIIIVSMVRNPSGHFNLDFIKKYQRINVALSRARKMLIIVGAKDFLSKKGIIDLPDISGNHILDKRNFPIFREIIETIESHGRVLKASDIIGE